MTKRNIVLDQEEIVTLRGVINQELQEITVDDPLPERSHQIQILEKLYNNLNSMTYQLQDQLDMNRRETLGFNS